MPDARCTRGLMCGSVEMVHMSIQGSGEHPTLPAQWLYGLWRDLPGGPGSLSPSSVRSASFFTNLTPAFGASGPHAFAVRLCRARLSQHRRPSHPRPTFVAIASAPLVGTGWVLCSPDLVFWKSEIFFISGLDTIP